MSWENKTETYELNRLKSENWHKVCKIVRKRRNEDESTKLIYSWTSLKITTKQLISFQQQNISNVLELLYYWQAQFTTMAELFRNVNK